MDAEAARDGLDELGAGDTVARYLVRAKLGAGGMGVVYAAHDPDLGREVAIKLLAAGVGSSDARALLEERLLREARALAQLAHPHVVAIHDVGRVGDRLFIAMELLDGGTLARWCSEAARAPRAILEHFIAAGRGLAAAHRAGIVHRDVKPENMMLGADGRVRVVDFGLARTVDSSSEPRLGGGTPRHDLQLTVTGVAVGTPRYMAPEQHRGEAADARTDQFGFCVALYTALFGVRPFPGDDLETLARSVQAGDVREPPRRRGVPRRIWRALRRGMSVVPAERHTSMDELLRQLEPRRRARWLPLVAGGAVAATAVAVVVAGRRGAEPAACTTMAEHLAGVWDAGRKDRLIAGLRATGAPFAEQTARTVAAQLDEYAAHWVAAREEACTATRVRGVQTEEAMQLRMGCLDDRLQELGALVDRLTAADRAIVARAVTATFALTDVKACGDVATLQYRAKPPRDPAELAIARAQLAEASGLDATGRYQDGLQLVAAAMPHVHAAGYRPIEAEAALLEGTLRNGLDDTDGALTTLDRAVWAAEACGHDEVAVAGLVRIIHLQGTRGNFPAADAAKVRATAALERIGRAPDLEADFHYAVGHFAFARGDLNAASQAFSKALQLGEAEHGKDDYRLARSLVGLGEVELQRMGERAQGYLERARTIEERTLGADHPQLGQLYTALGGLEYEHARYDEAAASYEHAIAILDKSIGHQTYEVANALGNLAMARQWQDRADDALAEVREAIAIDEQVKPQLDGELAVHLEAEAQILDQLRRPAEALGVVERALAMFRATYGDTHPTVADALHTRAMIQLELGRLESARTDALAALAMFRKVNASYPLAELDRTLGRIELARHQPAAALQYFEDAIANPRSDNDAKNAAYQNALYGRALVEAGRDRARGLALIRAAYAELRDVPGWKREADEIAGWLR